MGGADVRDRGEIRFDGGTPTSRRSPASPTAMHRRGPDGTGCGTHGPGRARPPPADDHRPVRARRAADGRRRAGPGRRVQRLHLQLPRAARRAARAAGYRFFSTSDTEVHRSRPTTAGALRCVDHFFGMFAFAIARARHRPADPGPRPAGHQAALPRRRPPDRLRFASLAAGAAGRRRRRHLDRPGRAAPLHDASTRWSRRRARSCAGVRKLPPATVRTIEPDGTRRPTTSTGRPSTPRPEQYAGLSATRLAGRGARDAADARCERRMVADVPGRRAALRRHRLQSLIVGAAGRGRPARAARRSASASTPPAGESGDEFEYSDLDRRASSTPTTTRS